MAITTTTFPLYVKCLPGVLQINRCSLLVFVTNVYSHATDTQWLKRAGSKKSKKTSIFIHDETTTKQQKSKQTQSSKESKSEWIKRKKRRRKKLEFMQMKRKSVWLEICIYFGLIPHRKASIHLLVRSFWVSVCNTHSDNVHAPHAINRSLFETKIENTCSFLLPTPRNIHSYMWMIGNET